MGFKDADWAYDIALPSVQKVVLIAIAHRTDDKTHQTYVSQKTVAGMVGMAVSTVNKSVGILEHLGVLSRQRRSGTGGYRTTDIIVINRSYISHTNVGDTNPGETNVGESASLLPSQAAPTSARRLAEEITQIDHSEDQPVKEIVQLKPACSIEDEFAEFWILYPRKQGKIDAFKAYKVARKTVDAKIIRDGAQAYALLTIGEDKHFLKLPAGWLRDGRWEDEQIPSTGRSTFGGRPLTRSEQNLAVIAQYAAMEGGQRSSRRIISGRIPNCPQHPGYPLEPTCAKCDRELEEGRAF